LNSDAYVELKDVRVVGDVVVPDSSYLQVMDQIIGSSAGMQLSFPDTEV